MSVILTFDQGNSSTKVVGFDSASGEECCCAVLRGASAMSLLKRTVDGPVSYTQVTVRPKAMGWIAVEA